ncbi:MAG: hypothetical protein ACKVT2_01820 [Saprospiraceae bacterium]
MISSNFADQYSIRIAMKSAPLWLALFLCSLLSDLSAQTDENNLPSEAFFMMHPDLAKWGTFFQENYFSKGYAPDSLGEGPGHLPCTRFWNGVDDKGQNVQPSVYIVRLIFGSEFAAKKIIWQ